MDEQIKKSESIINVTKGLAIFNKEVGKIGKTSDNPFYKSKYAGLPQILEAIAEPLEKAGLVISQFPVGTHCLETMLIHAESGEYISASYYMKPSKDDPQGAGSVITYQRRYAIGAILNLNIDEDDDGNKASGVGQKKTQATPAKKPTDPRLIKIAEHVKQATGKQAVTQKDISAYLDECGFNSELKTEHLDGIIDVLGIK